MWFNLFATASFLLSMLLMGVSMKINYRGSGFKVIPTKINLDVTNLDLRYNQISYVTNDSLASLKQLAILDMAFNGLRYIENGTFDKLAKLKELTLAGNNILHIPATFGKAERSLEKFGFYAAFAQASMKSFDYSRFPKLKYLNIEGNDRPRTQLGTRDLQLMGKYYENIKPLLNLEALIAGNNYMESIPDYFHLPLKYVDLKQNPLACNASLCWIRMWKYLKLPINKVFGTCKSPKSLKGKALMTLHPITMECYKGKIAWRHVMRIRFVIHNVEIITLVKLVGCMGKRLLKYYSHTFIDVLWMGWSI